jgi:Fe(3+) dicitrate transport protein
MDARKLWLGATLMLGIAVSAGIVFVPTALAEDETEPTQEQVQTEQSGPKEEGAETLKEVKVTAAKADEESPFMPDVQGTKIYAGKKTTVMPLNALPPITNNNYREALIKMPGLLLSEETTPLLSLGYRGLNPDRAQFMQVMKDGIPIQADMFGYPEAYYTPPFQTVEKLEFIRGGSALMYGPQPGGALNYVTKKPVIDKKFMAHSENVFGTDHYFSTYEAITGTIGPVGYLGYFHERQGDGFRKDNSDFEVISGGFKTIINQTGNSRLTLNYEEYHEEHGEPGGLSLTATTNPTYEQDRDFNTRQFDRFRLERYYGSLTFEKEFSEKAQFDFRLYGGHYRRYSKRQRGGGFGTVPTGPAASTNDIQEQDFYNLGFEPRLRHNYELLWGSHTLTLGTHTFFSHSPREEQRGSSPAADSGLLRKRSNRDLWYFSVFLENLFRWWRFGITPGVRLEHIWQRIEEKVNLDKTTAPLGDANEFDFVPLFGLGLTFDIFKTIQTYVNLSQSYRPKIFSDTVPLGVNQVINGDLDPGHGRQYDFGLRGNPAPFISWDTSFFILEFQNQTGTVGDTIQNVGDMTNVGWELATEIDVLGLWDFLSKTKNGEKLGSLSPFVNLTLLDAEFKEGPTNGRQPAYAPQYILRLGIIYRWRDRVKISLLSTFVDDHFADDANTLNRKIPSYKVWDLTGEINLLKNIYNRFDLSIFGGINNLFDENYYARITSAGIDPAYERNIYGGFKVNLG